MGLLGKFFGFRWSLYIVRDGNQLAYAMHENAVIGMVAYVMGEFANGGKPVEPWSLYLNFNHKNQLIKLGPEHFSPDGEHVTPLLIQQIESIDPGWKVKGGEAASADHDPPADPALLSAPAFEFDQRLSW